MSDYQLIFNPLASSGFTLVPTAEYISSLADVTSENIISALGYTPYDGTTNPNNYLTASSLSSSDITTTLGYFSPKFWGRGSWLALQALVIGLGLTIFHYLTWPIYVGYILGALLLAGFGYNWTQKYGDFIFGSWLGLIVWFIGKGL